MFPDKEGPRFIKGMSVCAAFMFFTTALALALRSLLVWENRRLDKKYGPKVETDPTKPTEASVAQDDYGANYRFVL